MPPTDTEKLQTRNRELSILNAIADALNREVDLARALDAALTKIAELFSLSVAAPRRHGRSTRTSFCSCAIRSTAWIANRDAPGLEGEIPAFAGRIQGFGCCFSRSRAAFCTSEMMPIKPAPLPIEISRPNSLKTISVETCATCSSG